MRALLSELLPQRLEVFLQGFSLLQHLALDPVILGLCERSARTNFLQATFQLRLGLCASPQLLLRLLHQLVIFSCVRVFLSSSLDGSSSLSGCQILQE